MKQMPIGEDTRPKDRVKLGLSPSATFIEIDARPRTYDVTPCSKSARKRQRIAIFPIVAGMTVALFGNLALLFVVFTVMGG